jgi:hypothetical protein
VGIDGYNSNTVEQTGTDSDCQNGSPTYYAWYEFYPHPSFIINTVTVKPGDTMMAEVVYNGHSSFTLTITDQTTVQSFSTTARLTSAQLSSAEWIAEAPSSSGGVLPLANFGTVFFGSDYTIVSSTNFATVGGSTGPIGSFPPSSRQEITMVDSSNNPIANPSALSADGTSFSISTSGSTTTTTTTTTTAGGSSLLVTVTTNQPSYTTGSWAYITVHVTGSGTPIGGASVVVTVTNPIGGTASGTGTTNSNGDATFRYRIGGGAPPGTYTIGATATATGYNTGSGSTNFTVT